jgi:hypothetical protein
MRLWTIHPQYLDAAGLVAVWREALLAQAVLRGLTRGYTRHPQLARFRQQADPPVAIALYLEGIYAESVQRGYRFDRSKIGPAPCLPKIAETAGQLLYEWSHLLAKLRQRAPQLYTVYQSVQIPEPHPLFTIVPGEIASWERQTHRVSGQGIN